MNNNRDIEEYIETGTINLCDRNISVKTGMNFLSSLASEDGELQLDLPKSELNLIDGQGNN